MTIPLPVELALLAVGMPHCVLPSFQFFEPVQSFRVT